MAFGATSRAPHGGIFVLFAIDNKLGFVIAILAGMVAAAAAVIFAKQFVKPSVKSDEAPALATV
jgi:PTS system fructose-specific IIC component